MQTKEILFYSHQHGVATAFAELIRTIAAEIPGYKITIYTQASLQAVYSDTGLTCLPVNSFVDLLKLLSSDSRPSLIITDTTTETDINSCLWSWARSQEIPSLGFVDQWSHIGERFAGQVRPDQILVIDEKARELIYQHLGPSANCAVVGHPYLSHLQEKATRPKEKNHKAVLTALLLSEPFVDASYETHFRDENGFDERDYLATAFEALSRHSETFQRQWKIQIRLHPRDKLERLSSVLRSLQIRAEWELSAVEKEQALQQADLVIGMRSIFLLEASLCGVPTLSLQPGRKKSMPATDDRPGLLVCTDTTKASLAIEQALLQTSLNNSNGVRIPTDSCQLFLNIILGKLGSK